MSWNAITEDDVLTVLAGPELEAIRAAALKAGQADPLQPTVDDVTDMVRGYVAGCASNQLGPDGTIPAKLVRPALNIIAVDIPNRVRQSIPDARKEARKEAIRLLEQVANCKFHIEAPVTVSEEDTGRPKPTIKSRTSVYGRTAQDGI